MQLIFRESVIVGRSSESRESWKWGIADNHACVTPSPSLSWSTCFHILSVWTPLPVSAHRPATRQLDLKGEEGSQGAWALRAGQHTQTTFQFLLWKHHSIHMPLYLRMVCLYSKTVFQYLLLLDQHGESHSQPVFLPQHGSAIFPWAYFHYITTPLFQYFLF